jgi:alcohol dehydrogenase, propanol-preferring
MLMSINVRYDGKTMLNVENLQRVTLEAKIMRAMVLHATGEPLVDEILPDPEPLPGQLLVRVEACGVCRTDLHIIDGDLKSPKLPLIPGHEIVGRVVRSGTGVLGFPTGQRVGVPWLGSTCGACDFCVGMQENLCDHARFTGYDINGGYAEFCAADARYCFPINDNANACDIAPLFCAGLIGYRSLRMVGDVKRIGIFGFGAAAHLITQVYAFTRPGDRAAQDLARDLGCKWAAGSGEMPPDLLDAAIIFAPVGALIPRALSTVRKGGIVVCGGIHMSDIPSFEYNLLWGERSIKSVANLTRQDAVDFLNLAQKIPVVAKITLFSLGQANEALNMLRAGTMTGAAVLMP